MSTQNYEKYQNFLSENFQFLVVKFSVHLNRHVFVMKNTNNLGVSVCVCVCVGGGGRVYRYIQNIIFTLIHCIYPEY